MPNPFPYLQAQAAMLQAALDDGQHEATTDDVRDCVDCPVGCDPRHFGAIPTQLRFAGLMHKVGHVYSRRKQARGREIGRWKLTDVDAAKQRLAQLQQRIKDKTEHKDSGRRDVQKLLF